MLYKSPLFINWNYTHKCNFNCKHCYSRSAVSEKELGTQEYLKIADQLAKHKVFQVNLGGGEPMLRGDYLQLISYMSSRGIAVNLSTNGWLINDEVAKKLYESGINYVFLSLDNADAEKHDEFRGQIGSYNKVIESISYLKKYHIKVKLSIVVTKLNINHIDEFVKIADENEVEGIDFKRFKPEGNGASLKEMLELNEEQEQELFSKIRYWRKKSKSIISLVYNEKPLDDIDDGCPCGKKSIAIRPNGDISPCVYNPIVIGNVLEDDLSLLWLDSPFLKHLRCNFSCIGLEKIKTK